MNWRTTYANLERLRTRKGRRTAGQIYVEGYRLLERSLESGVVPRAVLVSDAIESSPPPRASALFQSLQENGVDVQFAPDSSMQSFIEGRTFGPVLGIIETSEMPRFALRDSTTEHRRLLVLVNVMDPGNIGALSRTAMASGMDGLLAAGGTDLYHPKALRTSMGALFDLPIDQCDDWSALFKRLKGERIQSIGAVVHEGHPPTEGELSSRWALWVGSEAHGLPTPLQPQLDMRWTIPMPGCIDSFSVNAATAVLLYECNRRTNFHYT